MRKIFVANIDELKKFDDEIVNDNNYVFEIKNGKIHISKLTSNNKVGCIEIFLNAFDEMENVSIQDKYSIMNELLEPFGFGLRYSKKEIY